MKYFRKVCGENVYLSPMNIDDVEYYVKWWSDPVVSGNMGDAYLPGSSVSEREWLEEQLKKQEPHYAIVLKENDMPIGNVGFFRTVQPSRTAEIGIYIGEAEKRGKGYGTEALKLMIEFGFGVLNLNSILLRVYSFNTQAFDIYKKVGFKEIGRQRQGYYLNNKYHDIIYMDILRDEWYYKN